MDVDLTVIMPNVIACPLTAGLLYPLTGWLLSPEVAALSMSGSTLIVVANALVLKRAKMSESAGGVIPSEAMQSA